jgi:hypothetical protein
MAIFHSPMGLALYRPTVPATSGILLSSRVDTRPSRQGGTSIWLTLVLPCRMGQLQAGGSSVGWQTTRPCVLEAKPRHRLGSSMSDLEWRSRRKRYEACGQTWNGSKINAPRVLAFILPTHASHLLVPCGLRPSPQPSAANRVDLPRHRRT